MLKGSGVDVNVERYNMEFIRFIVWDHWLISSFVDCIFISFLLVLIRYT